MEFNAEYFIQNLGLLPHPEGGFYKETYRATEEIVQHALPQRFSGSRSYSTGIYFLLREGEFSHLHKIASDEMWHFYYGSPLTVYVLNEENASAEEIKLGTNLPDGEVLQAVVPHGRWFGAKVHQPGGFALVGCTVSPGFDFGDFIMAQREAMLQQFPHLTDVITSLTKP